MIIDGKKIANELLEELKLQIQSSNTIPSLAIILVGQNPASIIYVNNKIRQAGFVGIHAELYQMKDSTSQEDLIRLIESLNSDRSIHGIIVQLPLPSQINSQEIIQSIDPNKDVDGFHPINVGYLNIGIKKGFAPCTPLGCMHLLRQTLGNISGMHAVVVGRSNIVGKPLAQLLVSENCTVTIAHSKTHNLEKICKQADIVITAVGKPKMFSKEYFNKSATVIDVGINQFQTNEDSKKIVGDVDFEDVKKHVANITPVPGGVGPMTIAFLLKNTFKASIQNI